MRGHIVVRGLPSPLRTLFIFCIAVVALATTLLSANEVTFTSSCSENGSGVPCGTFQLPVEGGFGAGVAAGFSGFGTPSISATVGASAFTYAASGVYEAVASISTDFFATTAGPVRPGSMTYEVFTYAATGGPEGVAAADAHMAGVFSCPPQCSGTIPFTLGVPFEVALSAFASGDASGFYPLFYDSAGAAQYGLTINLFDSAGNPVDILSPVTTPEPAHLGLAVAALFGAGILVRTRDSRRTQKHSC